MPLSISGSFLLKTPSTIAVAVVWQEADVVALIYGGSAIAFGGLENSGLGDSGREGRCEGGGLYLRRVQQQQATGGGLIVLWQELWGWQGRRFAFVGVEV